jgi:hypothetical protein
LREVEERSLRFAQERGNLAFKLSASWLNRLEHELSVSKLIGGELYGAFHLSLPTRASPFERNHERLHRGLIIVSRDRTPGGE